MLKTGGVPLTSVVRLTETQKQRLRELGASVIKIKEKVFSSMQERDLFFKVTEKELIMKEKSRLQNLHDNTRRPVICQLEEILVKKLVNEGFVQVNTPIIITKEFMERMSISADSSLAEQVFWLSENTCLRPMLAPNLYYVLKRLIRLWKKPICIFEVGPCFRKDSRGSRHLNEFTMLNLVELGLPIENRSNRLEELISIIMKTVGLTDYKLVVKESEIYGDTIDVMTDIELCSTAMGPHKLDDNWGIVDPWVGLGFGLERLVMEKENYENIQRAGRSLFYLDGARLNI